MSIGPLHVRRGILIEAPPGRVWEEFQSFDRVNAWLGHGHVLHTFEPWVDGQMDFSVLIDGEERHFGGPVLVLEPEREISFESNWQTPYDWSMPTFWTLRLTAVYDGTLTEILHHGFERLGASAADELEGYESGWDAKHLQALRSIVGR